MLIRIAALAGVAFAGFKFYEKKREDAAFGSGDGGEKKDTWDMIQDEDNSSA